jgi:imidazolonepropionase-like amidohydrolase
LNSKLDDLENLAMKNLIVSAAILIFLAAFSTFAQTNKVYEFTNGQWFDGKGFKKQKMYSVNGFFTTKKPNKIDETIELKNQFVIPPFADAHTHNLDGTRNLEEMINAYLMEGTFYVQVLANYALGAKQARPFLNKPASLDVIYANGGLTSTLGHPFLAYEPRAMGFFNYADWEANMEKIKLSRIGENQVYWFLDSKADVDAKWEKFLAQKPDIVKILLLDAENYEKTRNSGKAGDKGLSPEVAEYVVQKAHQANLRVYAHVETTADFRLGLKIGVDGFAHSPNYGWNGKIEDAPKDDLTLADIKLAAKQKVFITPTANIGRIESTIYADGKEDLQVERFNRVIERQKKLFNLMCKNGVKVILGSDYFGKTLGVELWHLHDNKIFDNKTLLKIAVEDTPQAVFPNRKIGKLRDGYEASFLVLQENPIKDFAQLKNITLRFKQGNLLR